MSIEHQELVKKYLSIITNSQKTLNLIANHIGDEGTKALATTLPNSSLTMLNLRSNYIGNQGAKALADALPSSSLTILNLRHNCIEDEGTKALAATLPSSSLTMLNLRINYIGNQGAKALATALPNSSLTTLNLRVNDVGDEGTKALATALPNSSLTMLNLRSNNIGDEGAKALANVLPSSSLTMLNLRVNDIKDEGRQQLEKAIFAPNCRTYRTGIDTIDKKLKPRKEKFLATANRFLPGKYIDERTFNQHSKDEKITLFFEKLDAIKCRNQFMQHFMGKDGNCTKKIGTLMPIKELSQHIMSFVYPGLSSQDITEAWAMAEDKLAEMTEQNNPFSDIQDKTDTNSKNSHPNHQRINCTSLLNMSCSFS